MVDSGNFSVGQCYNFSQNAKDAAFIIQLSAASIGSATSFLVIILILLSKGHNRFIYRLVIYFMTVVLVHALTHIMNVLPIDFEEDLVRVKYGWLPACKFFGFLDQTMHFAVTFSMLWIVIYLIYFSWKLYRLQEEMDQEQLNTENALNNGSQNTCTISRKEMAGLVAVFLLPFFFSWVPFLWDMYGFTGLLCWIRLSRHDTCADQTLSITLMLVMYYVPVLLVSLFIVVTLLIIVVLMCRGSARMRGIAQMRFNRGVKEILFVLIYPLIFAIFSGIVVGIHIYSTVHRDETPTFTYTVVYIVGVNARVLMPSVGFLLNPYSWKYLIIQCTRTDDDDDTSFYVPPEDDDIAQGITIRGSVSNTNNYESLLASTNIS